jgi:hypothetical protein
MDEPKVIIKLIFQPFNKGYDNVVACKSSGVANHYYNPDSHNPSRLLDRSEPSVGISNVSVIQDGSVMVCRFERRKKYPITNAVNAEYFDLNKKYYILAAYGDLDSQGNVVKGTKKKFAYISIKEVI